MRSVLGFFSMLALGLMIAAILVVSPSGVVNNPGRFGGVGATFDTMSVMMGLGIGLAIAVLGQISWARAVRSIAVWVMGQARRIWLIGWAAAFVAVLIYF
jgi:hypothetical protein